MVNAGLVELSILARLNVAVGVGGGYDNEDASPDMTFEQLQGRSIGVRPTRSVFNSMAAWKTGSF